MPKSLGHIILVVLVFTLIISTIVSYGEEGTDLEIKYGTSSITIKVVDDFSESGEPDKVWKDGFVELKDGRIYCDGITIADCYLITIQKANENKSVYIEADYIGFEIKNDSDGDIYYCFQGIVDGNDAFTSPVGDKDVILVDKHGFLHEVVFSDDASVYSRYGFIIPKGFDGYVMIPTTRITRLGTWDKPLWHGDVTIDGVGVHVSLGENAYPEVDATFIEFSFDNFFVFSGEFAEYEAPETPEPTATPTPEPTKEPTPTPTKNTTPTATKGSSNKDDQANFLMIPLIIGAGALILVAVVIFIFLKRRKK